MGTKENKELVRKFWEAAAKSDYDAFGDFIAEDGVDHTPMPGQPPGVEGVKYIFRMLRAAMPDFSQEIVDMVAEGDRVVVRAVSRGTHQGEMLGIPPTGKKVQVDEIHIVRVQDGKMIEHWGLVDQAALMAQLGVMPGGN